MINRIIAGLIVLWASIPCLAQEYTWAMQGGSFFPFGWTADGTLFAYGTFDYSIMISNQGRFRAAVQNMKTDKIVWDFGTGWDEGNAGDGSGDIVPRSAPEAWERVKKDITPHLARHKISMIGSATPCEFPIRDNDSLRATIIERPGEGYQDSFQVRAVSGNLGAKTIYDGAKTSAGNELVMLGYFPNADFSRIAVVIEERSFSFPFPSYYVIGCHARNGFKKE